MSAQLCYQGKLKGGGKIDTCE
jgi:aryl-alcohol dehydrogenase-like predicted oxidoreductase